MMWDYRKAVQQLKENASQESRGRSAEAVVKAIEAGGIALAGKVGNSAETGRLFRSAGFRPIAVNMEAFMPGDVAVFEAAESQPVTMAMFDGKSWVSDFRQPGLYPSAALRKQRTRYTIYRYTLLWETLRVAA